MEIAVGTKIEWLSGAGHLTGTVKSITLSPSAANRMTPWLIVHQISNVLTGKQHLGGVMLCGTHDNMVGMSIKPVGV